MEEVESGGLQSEVVKENTVDLFPVRTIEIRKLLNVRKDRLCVYALVIH